MILDVIVEDKLKKLPVHKSVISEEEMKRQALASTRKSISFYDALSKDGLSIIGEFKKASPSHGTMDNKINLRERIKQYSESADAISCLTEEDHFNGSVEYLKEIRQMTTLPIIRKDFIIDPYQVYEAKVIGADAILLIAAILDDNKFKELYDLAYSLGLDVLCEVHDEEEMQRMLNLDVKIIGINNRNLKTFEIDLNTTKRLADMVTDDMRKSGKLLVSESGVQDSQDVAVLAHSNADALLIGTVLMEAESPVNLIREYKDVYNLSKK
ncbi:MAG: indole-3-glycerol phosphate synthase TrpC [Eubacteriales bacterium]|nr:indole-3-glycerol phosphate synthase TrpC [Eubacteriales bacterium]